MSTYKSTITFTLDTICPWTYLAFVRLRSALAKYRSSNPSTPIHFVLRIAPYQLYPDFSESGEDKYEWYKNNRFDGSEERMQKYIAAMDQLGRQEGIKFEWGKGTIANTLHAHRVLHCVQERYVVEKTGTVAEQGEEVMLKLLASLYKQYFEEGAHPSSAETLLRACRDVGLSEDDAKKLVEQNRDEGLSETRMAIREQAGNGVDSVPYVVFEGKRRDFTEIGAKSVEEYGKVLDRITKEAT